MDKKITFQTGLTVSRLVSGRIVSKRVQTEPGET